MEALTSGGRVLSAEGKPVWAPCQWIQDNPGNRARLCDGGGTRDGTERVMSLNVQLWQVSLFIFRAGSVWLKAQKQPKMGILVKAPSWGSLLRGQKRAGRHGVRHGPTAVGCEQEWYWSCSSWVRRVVFLPYIRQKLLCGAPGDRHVTSCAFQGQVTPLAKGMLQMWPWQQGHKKIGCTSNIDCGKSLGAGSWVVDYL